MATMGTLRTEARNLLDDAAGTRWTDADLLSYLNDAQYEFAMATGSLTKKITLTLTTGVSEYTLSFTSGSDTLGLAGPLDTVYFSNTTSGLTRTLYPTTEKQLDSTVGPTWRDETFNCDTLQTPVQYYLTADTDTSASSYAARFKIGIYRKPTIAGGATNFKLVVSAPVLPITLTNTSDIPEIFLQFHQALPYGCAYRALLRNQDTVSLELAGAYKTRFNEFVEMARATLGGVR